MVLKTTHQLAVPGIPTREGTSAVTYYVMGRDKACSMPLDEKTCPRLGLELDAYRSRSYVIMLNRGSLRQGAAWHPSSAVLVAEDGEGTVVRIETSSEHPLAHDAWQTFRSLESCTKDADTQAGALM